MRARVDTQHEKIAELKSTGHDTTHAKFLLITMLATLALYVDRYRILSLARPASSPVRAKHN